MSQSQAKARAAQDIQMNLHRIIRDQLLPCVQAPHFNRLFLAELPLHTPPEITVTACPVPLLKEPGRGIAGVTQKSWVKEKLQASSVPHFGFVADGTMHYAIGVTQRMARAMPAGEKVHGRYRLVLPAGTVFVVPPRVPHVGGEPHWEGPNPERAASRVFWLHAHPGNIICHTCTTRGRSHTTSQAVYLRAPRLDATFEMLIEELRNGDADSVQVARAYLTALLLRAEHEFRTGRTVAIEADNNEPDVGASASDAAPTSVLQRACYYVEANLDKPLSPDDIARHAYISPSHLNRIFRQELQLSIMDYVAQCRANTARALLQDTELPVFSIATLVGHGSAAHFTRRFRQWTQMSPQEYRRAHRTRKPR